MGLTTELLKSIKTQEIINNLKLLIAKKI